MRQLTNMANETVKSSGLSFTAMMDALVDFLSCVQAQSETIPIIIAHGGFSNDFPILHRNCIKLRYGNYCAYVDSMLMFRNAGYVKPGLDALFQEFNIAMEVRDYHSVLHNAELLMAICMEKMDLLLLLVPDHSLSFDDISIYHTLNIINCMNSVNNALH